MKNGSGGDQERSRAPTGAPAFQLQNVRCASCRYLFVSQRLTAALDVQACVVAVKRYFDISGSTPGVIAIASTNSLSLHRTDSSQVVRTSVPWRYEVQQIDVVAPAGLATAEVYLSLPESDNDTTTDFNGTSWPVSGASLLDPSISADDLAAALDSLPSAGQVTVRRVSSEHLEDSFIASRHLVTFLSRGGDVPLLYVQNSTVTESGASNDTDLTYNR